jgi:hypothetical protein
MIPSDQVVTALKGDSDFMTKAKGPAGKDGVNGVNGQDGAQGPSGDKGEKGDAGKDGVDGIDGTNPTPEEVAAVLEPRFDGRYLRSGVLIDKSLIPVLDASKLGANSVSSETILDRSVGSQDLALGSIGAIQIDSKQVQRRVGSCAAGMLMTGVAEDGTPNCTQELGDISRITASGLLSGGGATGEVTISLDQARLDSLYLKRGENVTTIADNAIGSSKVVDGAIVASKIADGQVTGAKIASGAIGSQHLADKSVTNRTIADGAINLRTINLSEVQSRVWGSCANGAIRSIGLGGEVICADALSGPQGPQGPAGPAINVNPGSDYYSITDLHENKGWESYLFDGKTENLNPSHSSVCFKPDRDFSAETGGTYAASGNPSSLPVSLGRISYVLTNKQQYLIPNKAYQITIWGTLKDFMSNEQGFNAWVAVRDNYPDGTLSWKEGGATGSNAPDGTAPFSSTIIAHADSDGGILIAANCDAVIHGITWMRIN